MFGVFKKGHKNDLIIAINIFFLLAAFMNNTVLFLLSLQHSSRYENNLSKYNHFLLESCDGL